MSDDSVIEDRIWQLLSSGWLKPIENAHRQHQIARLAEFSELCSLFREHPDACFAVFACVGLEPLPEPGDWTELQRARRARLEAARVELIAMCLEANTGVSPRVSMDWLRGQLHVFDCDQERWSREILNSWQGATTNESAQSFCADALLRLAARTDDPGLRRDCIAAVIEWIDALPHCEDLDDYITTYLEDVTSIDPEYGVSACLRHITECDAEWYVNVFDIYETVETLDLCDGWHYLVPIAGLMDKQPDVLIELLSAASNCNQAAMLLVEFFRDRRGSVSRFEIISDTSSNEDWRKPPDWLPSP